MSHPLLRMEERVKDTDDQSIHTFITNYSIYVQTVTNLRSYHTSFTVLTVNTIYNPHRNDKATQVPSNAYGKTQNKFTDEVWRVYKSCFRTMTVAETSAEASYAECHSLIISQTLYGQVMSHINKQALYL